jgi:hypothetical protein
MKTQYKVTWGEGQSQVFNSKTEAVKAVVFLLNHYSNVVINKL